MRGLGELTGLDIVAAAGHAPCLGEPSRPHGACTWEPTGDSLLRGALRRLSLADPGDARCRAEPGRDRSDRDLAGAACANRG